MFNWIIFLAFIIFMCIWLTPSNQKVFPPLERDKIFRPDTGN